MSGINDGINDTEHTAKDETSAAKGYLLCKSLLEKDPMLKSESKEEVIDYCLKYTVRYLKNNAHFKTPEKQFDFFKHLKLEDRERALTTLTKTGIVGDKEARLLSKNLKMLSCEWRPWTHHTFSRNCRAALRTTALLAKTAAGNKMSSPKTGF